MEGVQERLAHSGLDQSLSDSFHPSVCSDVRLLVGTCWRPDPRHLVGLQKEVSPRHSEQMPTHLTERRRRPNAVKAATYRQTVVVSFRTGRNLRRLLMPEICSLVNPNSSPEGLKLCVSVSVRSLFHLLPTPFTVSWSINVPPLLSWPLLWPQSVPGSRPVRVFPCFSISLVIDRLWEWRSKMAEQMLPY